jgi:hypothetical protein
MKSDTSRSTFVDVRRASQLINNYRSNEILDVDTAEAVARSVGLGWLRMNDVAVVSGERHTGQVRLFPYRRMKDWIERKGGSLSLLPGADRYALWSDLYGGITYAMIGADPGAGYDAGSVMGQVARATSLGKKASEMESGE